MIIKKLIDICKKSATIILYDTENEQWLSDGNCIFPLYNLPMFDENTLCKTYDITDKQQEKIYFKRETELPENLNITEYINGEVPCQQGPIKITAGGNGLISYMTSQGIVFINEKYLSPIGDINDDTTEMYERYTTDGKMYFAVGSGFVLIGLIMPYDCIDQKFIDNLSTLYQQCKIALYNKRKNEPAEDAMDSYLMTTPGEGEEKE